MNKKGFTLIELLAVILILGIIALIAIPTISKIIDDAGKGAFETTLNNIERKIEDTCNLERIKNKEITSHYTIINGVITPSINIKGDLPDGEINVDNNCGVTFNLHNKTYTGIKENSKGQISIDKGSNNSGKTAIIKEHDITKSYVGYYADIDGDKNPDGIIYADLITGAIKNGQWTNANGTYSIPVINDISTVKDYYISKEEYAGKFGTKPVLSKIPGSTGSDRFYVMALDDFEENVYYNWYYKADEQMTDFNDVTSQAFGTGKSNTINMLEKWNSEGYGEKNGGTTYDDMWGKITDKVNSGWYVPSRAEWSAFGGELNISTSNRGGYGLSSWYWSSSQNDESNVWIATFYNCTMNSDLVGFYSIVRLATNY